MNKMTKLLITSMLIAGSTTAFAADTTPAPDTNMPAMTHHKQSGHGMRGADGMFKGLNLTQQQKDQMRTLAQQSRKDEPRMNKEDMESMHALITADTFDQKAAEQQAQKMVAHQVADMKLKNEMYKLLTPEQKAQFNKNFQEHQTRMQNRPMMKTN